MQKKIIAIAATILCAGVAPALAQSASKVELYGIVDLAVRSTSNHGKTQMIGGGMSQSRWGINVTEDLGGGLSAVANLENRIDADTGDTNTGRPFFQQSWLGLRSTSWGQLTMGRQFNVLFDLTTSTYASFPYSPYMDAFKPEIGLAMGARNDNMLKYVVAFGPVRAALQYSFDEGDTTTPGVKNGIESKGGYVRYQEGGLALGTGYLQTTFKGGLKVDAYTVGGSYRTGPWYLNAGYAQNKRKNEFAAGVPGGTDLATIAAYWSGQTNGGFSPGSTAANFSKKREMFKVGVGNQITPKLNVGIHYYHAKQSGSATGAFNNKANFVVAVADYAFSKRTDAYLGVDHTKVSGGEGSFIEKVGDDLVRSRTGVTIGLRHRF